MGVLRIWLTKSSALAMAAGPVSLPRMISTSGIFSTGEKKWTPMKFSGFDHALASRSEEHTSELQSLMRISYAVFCLKKKKTKQHTASTIHKQQQHALTPTYSVPTQNR